MRPTRAPRSVHVYGMPGHNLGDDAIAVAVNRELAARLPGAEIRSATLIPGALRERYGLAELPIDRRTARGWARLVRSVARADAVVLGGGTLIQDALGLTRLRGNLAYVRQLAWLARRFGTPVFTVGIGVDELGTPLGRRYARAVLAAARFHYLRDARSAELANAYAGGAMPEHRVGADPAILMGRHAPAASQAPATRDLVVSLVHEGLDAAAWFPALEATARALRDRGRIDGVTLLAMDRRPGEEAAWYPRLSARLEKAGLAVRTVVPDDAFHARAVLRCAGALVAMRLHAMILALGATPIVALSRTTKTDTFAAAAEIPSFDVRRVPEGDALANAVLAQTDDAAGRSRQGTIRRRMERDADAAFDRLADVIAEATGAARTGLGRGGGAA